MLSYPLVNVEIQKHFKTENTLHAVSSRKCLTEKK